MSGKICTIMTLLFCTYRLLSMDYVQKDSFSTLANIHRRPIVFELLKECKTPHQARKQLVSMGLASRKSYEQINCPFFIRDVVKFLATKYRQTNEAVAAQLGIAGAQKYNAMGGNLICATQVPSNAKFYRRVYPLSYQGVDFNFRCMGSSMTPLMCAVKVVT